MKPITARVANTQAQMEKMTPEQRMAALLAPRKLSAFNCPIGKTTTRVHRATGAMRSI